MSPEVHVTQGDIRVQLRGCKERIFELESENERLRTEIAEKDEVIRSLEEQVRKLTRKATINSSNSS